MPKKAKKNKKKLSTKAKFVLLFVGIFMAGVLIPPAVLRFRLDRTVASLENIGVSISAERPGVAYSTEKGCRRDVEKFGGGVLRCYVGLTLNFEDDRGIGIEEHLNSNGWTKMSSQGINHEFKNNRTGIGCGVTQDDRRIVIRCFEKTKIAVYSRAD